MKVILTGATGMVGEGVLLECLQNSEVTQVLIVNRRSFNLSHPELIQLVVPDFLNIENDKAQLAGYDACFFCAGISSVGMNEEEFTHVTHTITLHVAKVLLELNPQMVFNYVSGAHTKINGKQMWQRVKGKTEADLVQLGFRGEYNFRPGFMKPVKGQRNVKWFFKPVIAVFPLMAPRFSLTLNEVGQAMINVVKKPYPTQILEIKDIKLAAEGKY